MHIRIRKIPSITIFHDPTLTASKHALKILKHVSNLKKYNVDLIQDKKNPPEPEIIARIVHLLAPGDIPTGCKLILTEDAPKASTVEEVQAILARNPLLFKKPLLVDWAQGKAIIGEPALKVHDLFPADESSKPPKIKKDSKPPQVKKDKQQK